MLGYIPRDRLQDALAAGVQLTQKRQYLDQIRREGALRITQAQRKH